ncbi:MAG: ferritin-like domain-containing protein [Planctomycetes bacterium]|nr:ferritin-like domain-containing protein [Planctomycetota bacterium]
MSATGLAADVAAVLAEPDVLRKIAAADALCEAARRGALDPRFERGAPQRPARPARVVVTGSLATRRRADLCDARGRRSLIHAVAHIELCAIELALLAVADFPGEEADYYRDMLAIAGEEALHARLLLARLHELGGELGEEPLHLGLWETAIRFPELPDRLAIVPRVLEAKGLDVSAKLRHELRAAGDEASAALLDRVYRDEIGHVAIGTRWHRVACARRGLDAERHFLALARPLRPRRSAPPPLDRAGRLAAGFSERELDGLAEPADAVDRADTVDAAERTPR